jgi:hypothetical protein
MQCRITDEQVSNPWDSVDESPEKKTTETLSLHDLMAQDFYVYMTKNKEGYQLDLEDEDGKHVIGKNIHPCAMESMIKVCTRFILHYNQIRKSEAA